MSITLEFLPLLQDELPVEKIFTFDKQYVFMFRENVRHSRIYCEIRDTDDNILYTTRLIYGHYIIHAVVDNLDIEDSIIPFNIDDLMTDSAIDDSTVEPGNLSRVKNYVTS